MTASLRTALIRILAANGYRDWELWERRDGIAVTFGKFPSAETVKLLAPIRYGPVTRAVRKISRDRDATRHH